MKYTILCALTWLRCSHTKDFVEPPSIIGKVDLERYLGLWYEIAAYPQWYERGMSNIKAEYSLSPKGYIKVTNSGIKHGQLKIATGKARVVNAASNAKLKVSFFGPFYGQYWIVDLSDDYSWAVVSNQKRTTLWILSRTPTLDDTIYNSVLDRLCTRGFNLSKLIKTQQN